MSILIILQHSLSNSLMITPHPTEGVISSPPHLLTQLKVSIYMEVPVVWELFGAKCFQSYQVAGLLVGFGLDLNRPDVALNGPQKGTFSQLN